MNDELLNAYKRLLNEQTSLMSDYRKLLAESESDERLAIILKKYPLFFPYMVVENRCPLADRQSKDIMDLMVGGSSKAGHRHLDEFTHDASNLIIIDPYFFKTPPKELLGVINGSELSHIHVVYDHSKAPKNSKLKKVLMDKKINLTSADSSDIHDRIWIKNISAGKVDCRAKVVGTSLNGLGKKAAFILDLPHDDLAAIIKFMGQHSLLGELQHHIQHFA